MSKNVDDVEADEEDEMIMEDFRAEMGITMTKEEALRAIAAHGVTIEDILAVMPQEQDKTHPHYEDAKILEAARDAELSLSDVLRDASYNGGPLFAVDLIGWIEEWVRDC